MNKLISLKLKKIAYSGDDIGPNFHFTFKIFGQKLEIVERVKRGSFQLVDSLIFCQFIEEASLPIALEILEEDPVFDETATHQFSILINDLLENQTHSISIDILGQGWENGRTATLTFDFEVSKDEGNRYIADVDGKGWLLILPEWITKKTQLAFTTKVKLTKIADDREYFLIEEGPFSGKLGSVRKRRSGDSYLLPNFEYKPAANLLFEKKSKKLTIDGLGKFVAETWDGDPNPNGIHELEFPSAPHNDLGGPYLNDSSYAQTWFRIGHSGDKFLHCGQRSLGCITVKETKKWTDIYQFLIRCRKDQLNIGTVRVTD